MGKAKTLDSQWPSEWMILTQRDQSSAAVCSSLPGSPKEHKHLEKDSSDLTKARKGA